MRILPLVVLTALALAGCGGNEGDGPAPSAATTPTAAGSTERETAKPPAGNGPDISGTGLDGEALSVADFRGKPVFVNVWSSW